MNKMTIPPSIEPVEEEPDERTVPDLVIRAQKGDEQAFSTLLNMYYGKTYGIAYGMLSNVDDARDLNQRIWTKIWKNIERFRRDSGFYTWVYRIATRECIDFIRKVRRAPFVEPFGEEGPSLEENVKAVSYQEPDRQLLTRDRLEQFERALEALSAEHRMALTLREIEGLSYDEIAEAMDCRKGTVMSRLHHARRHVREFMEREDEV